MEVDHVEIVGAAAHLGEHRHVGGEVGLQRRGVQPDRLVTHGNQLGLGMRVGAREQGDVVTQIDQRVGQVGHDPFSAAVEARGNGFIKRGNLRDFHCIRLPGPNMRRPPSREARKREVEAGSCPNGDSVCKCEMRPDQAKLARNECVAAALVRYG